MGVKDEYMQLYAHVKKKKNDDTTICIFTAATSPADELGGEEREEAEKDVSRRILSLCLLILRMFAHRLSYGLSEDLLCLVF